MLKVGRPKLPSDERIKRIQQRQKLWYINKKIEQPKIKECEIKDMINDHLYYNKYLSGGITIDEYIKLKEQFIKLRTYKDYKKLLHNISLLT